MAAPCPPGLILNPQTLRCVKITGRKGQQIARYQGFPAAPALVAGARTGLAAAFSAVEPPRLPTFWERATAAPALAAPAVAAAAAPMPCPPGYNRNPTTGRCIRRGGRTYKKLYPPAPPAPPRRATSEAPAKLPVGSAEPIPLGPPEVAHSWIRDNCKNPNDPISGLAWTDADTAQLTEIMRLHDRTCVTATGLHSAVKSQHRTGKPATIPGDPHTALTLDDFKALRTTMRRRDPAYKIPARAHQPAPANWQLYVASDNRSGPDFASVLIVDAAKAKATPAGYQYPAESVMIDLGFIPTAGASGALCQPQMLVDLLDRLAKSNRLLEPVAGGWKPVFTPRSKTYWAQERADRISRLCRELTKALTTPL